MKTIQHLGLRYPFDPTPALDDRKVAMRKARSKVLIAAVLAIALLDGPAFADHSDVDELISMSIEDLMNLEVTSVSKQEQNLMGAAAAIFVITNEDLRRSGATSIPDALRMVPGMQVSQLSNGKWAVSARGFNDLWSNNLLVLIDGRSIYTPSFSGVFWETQELVMADIERIEVIRGPGATLWGANAVAGVINILTKDALETTGTIVEVLGSEHSDLALSLRHGAHINSSAHIRTYLKYREEQASEVRQDANDHRQIVRGGFRMDWLKSATDKVTLQGDAFWGQSGVAFWGAKLTSPYLALISEDDEQVGANILARWTREKSSGSNIMVQTYIDHDDRDIWGYGVKNTIFDVEMQHDFATGPAHKFTWGLGYRAIFDEYTDSSIISTNPTSRDQGILSGFGQSEYGVLDNRLKFIVGSKFEYNDYTGFEIQPNIRASFTTDTSTLWASVSRAVRTPSRTNNDFLLSIATLPPGSPGNPGPYPLLMQIVGNESLDSEELLAYEIGARTLLGHHFWIDVTAYYDVYTGILGTTPGVPQFNPLPPTPYVGFPLVFQNKVDVDIFGFEVAAKWSPSDVLEFDIAYTYTTDEVVDTGGASTEPQEYAGPEHQASLRTHIDMGSRTELDLWLRYVDEMENLEVSSYTDLDVQVRWRLTDNVEFSLSGQNLLDEDRFEFARDYSSFLNTPVERAIYASLKLSFGGE